MKRVLSLLKSSKGMTLTEVMVGIAMIALVSTMMASGFLAATILIRRGADVSGASSLAGSYADMTALDASSVEGLSVTQRAGDGITVNGAAIGGKYYGYVYQANDETEPVEYIIFIPD